MPHPATRAINHMLRATPLALERVRALAGRTVAFHVGPMTIAVTAQTTGEVEPAVPGAARDLDVRLSPFLLPRLAANDDAAYGEIEMQGDQHLAEEVRLLARNLRWDVEEDLSHVVGDIAAHRITESARTARKWAGQAALRITQSAAEYWTEERPLIASRVKVETFVADVKGLAADLERLEERIARLESKAHGDS